MKELIKVELNDNQEPIVSGRMLHEFLGIGTEYAKWFSRMIEYGFIENIDFTEVFVKNDENSKGGRPAIDHAIKLDMAKELSMIQRNERGKQARQYFIKVQKDWNTPEKVMARALILANKTIDSLTSKNKKQRDTIKQQNKEIKIMKPKADYYDLVLQCKDLIPINIIAKDYGMTAQQMNKMLKDKQIQYKQGNIWLLYKQYASKGYTSTKTNVCKNSQGSKQSNVCTYWTQKGRLFIYETLKKDNILPLMEQKQTKQTNEMFDLFTNFLNKQN